MEGAGMSKYKVGDKFLVEIKEVLTTNFNKNIYFMKWLDSFTFDDCELDRLKRVQNETEIDWSKVVIDTPILVSNDGNKWLNRYFAKYTSGKVYAFANGSTSWSFDKKDCKLKDWKYVKLANS
jgi:hypothetical protein